MKEEEWDTCAKKDEFKRMIVGLLFFHANIQVAGLNHAFGFHRTIRKILEKQIV